MHWQLIVVDFSDIHPSCWLKSIAPCPDQRRCQYYYNNDNRKCEQGMAGYGFQTLNECYDTCSMFYIIFLTLFTLKSLCTTLLPNLYPVHLQHSSCKLVFTIRVENSVNPDQMASSEANWSGSTVFENEINPGSAGQGLTLCMLGNIADFLVACRFFQD